MKKILIFIFIIFLLSKPAGTFAADLSLQTPKTKLKTEENFSVNIVLSGGENTLGTDIVLLYDPQKLEALSVKEAALYPSYQPVSIRRFNNKDGKISLSGSANLNQPVRADGVFGIVTFRTRKAGDTKIYLDYTPTATNKTGVISFAGSNLLTRPPSELQLTIEKDNFFLSIFSQIKAFIQNITKLGSK